MPAGERQPLHSAPQERETDRASIPDLLAELTAQITTIHRIFDRRSENVGSLNGSKDVVFIDDLAHCMECSWAKLEPATNSQLTPDIVAQCSRLLEASLQVLKQIQDMQMMPDNRSSTD